MKIPTQLGFTLGRGRRGETVTMTAVVQEAFRVKFIVCASVRTRATSDKIVVRDDGSGPCATAVTMRVNGTRLIHDPSGIRVLPGRTIILRRGDQVEVDAIFFADGIFSCSVAGFSEHRERSAPRRRIPS